MTMTLVKLRYNSKLVPDPGLVLQTPLCIGMSNSTMWTILGKGSAQAQVHAEFIAQVPSMHKCLSKTFSQNCLHGEIAFSNSTCIYFVVIQGKKGRQKNLLWRNDIL